MIANRPIAESRRSSTFNQLKAASNTKFAHRLAQPCVSSGAGLTGLRPFRWQMQKPARKLRPRRERGRTLEAARRCRQQCTHLLEVYPAKHKGQKRMDRSKETVLEAQDEQLRSSEGALVEHETLFTSWWCRDRRYCLAHMIAQSAKISSPDYLRRAGGSWLVLVGGYNPLIPLTPPHPLYKPQ